MQGADHIASTFKRCRSNDRSILKIVNILEEFKNASPQNTKNFNCSMADGISFDVSLSLNCTDFYKREGGA